MATNQKTTPTTLLGLNTEELGAVAREQGEPTYRGKQLAEWIYRWGVREFAQMTNLPNRLRAQLSDNYQVGRSQLVFARHSRDATVKLLLAMGDGQTVETVGLPYASYFSCCVSTQVGCPVRCAFCATGMSGYTRNLTAGEIVDQVLTVQEAVKSPQPPLASPLSPLSISDGEGVGGEARRVSHVVFMGMGEPLLNYADTVKAVRLFNSELGIGMRHLTVSTVGFVPGIRQLAQERLQITLAVSLHAPNDDLRRRLIPTMIRWDLDEILDACRDYFRQTGRRVTFEYCLLDRVNDGVAEARELAQVLRGLNCHVNLIPYNPVVELGFEAPSAVRVRAFREVLEQAGIPVTQRVQRGADIEAACGQLRRATISL